MYAGAAAPLVYVAAVVVGGWLWPGYSHLVQPVSDLLAERAPTKALMDYSFGIYNVLTFAFSLGLLGLVIRQPAHRRFMLGICGSVALLVEANAGLLTLVFPQPAGGAGGISSAGAAIHIALAGLSSLTSVLAALFVGLWLRGSVELRIYGTWSLATAAFVFATGAAAAVAIATRSGVAGLLQRLTIGGFLQWLFVLALLGMSLAARHPADDPLHYTVR